jgi:hypothetical protein
MRSNKFILNTTVRSIREEIHDESQCEVLDRMIFPEDGHKVA